MKKDDNMTNLIEKFSIYLYLFKFYQNDIFRDITEYRGLKS